MRIKTTLILLAVFVGLLAVVLLIDSRSKKKEAAAEKTNTLISLVSGDVRKASLVRGAETLTFERDEGGPWRLTSPIPTAADEAEVNGLVDALTSLRLERVVDKEGKDPAAYEIPKTTVSLWTKGQDAPLRLLVGMENPLDKSLFAKREDDSRIVLLSSTLKTTLDKTVFDFRQKDVFKFTAADVKGIRVKAKDVAWQAVREESGWFLKAPVAALAAKGKIDSLLDSLSGLRAKEFVAEEKDPASLKAFGLDKPDYEVALSLPALDHELVFALHKKGEAQYAMSSPTTKIVAEEKDAASLKAFGLDKPDYEIALSLPALDQELVFTLHKQGESQYAASSPTTKIVAFEGTLLADLDRKVDELREKKVADLYAWDAQRISLKRDGLEIVAVKEKIGEEDKWLLDPASREEADKTKVEDLLRKIEGLEAAAFVDKPGPLADYGLGPGTEVRVLTKDYQGQDKETVLFIGEEDAEKRQVAVKNALFDYLFLVDSAFLQDLPKEKKDWKPEPPKAADEKPDKK